MEKLKLKILVVDDERGWRDLLSMELSSSECEVVTAASAAEALEFLHELAFDLVITDIRMPGAMDGIDLIRSCRGEKPGQKAIFMTGYAVEEKIEQVLSEGAAVCIKKPFASEELMNAIELLLPA